MKTKNAILLMSVMVILTANNACKTPKSVEVATGAKEVSLPFSGKEFKSDKEYFRAMGSGKSPDKEDARRIAALSASQRLSANIKEVLSSAMRQYTQTLDGNGKQEFEGSFSNQTWTFVEQTLVHSTVKDEKLFVSFTVEQKLKWRKESKIPLEFQSSGSECHFLRQRTIGTSFVSYQDTQSLSKLVTA